MDRKWIVLEWTWDPADIHNMKVELLNMAGENTESARWWLIYTNLVLVLFKGTSLFFFLLSFRNYVRVVIIMILRGKSINWYHLADIHSMSVESLNVAEEIWSYLKV